MQVTVLPSQVATLVGHPPLMPLWENHCRHGVCCTVTHPAFLTCCYSQRPQPLCMQPLRQHAARPSTQAITAMGGPSVQGDLLQGKVNRHCFIPIRAGTPAALAWSKGSCGTGDMSGSHAWIPSPTIALSPCTLPCLIAQSVAGAVSKT
jgi:hypothetical protein